MELRGHLALITGAGQGIGRASAEVFALKGADLFLFDKNSTALSEVADKTAQTGRQVFTRALDLTDIDALKKVVKEVKSKGRIDILVNNAGFDRPGTVAKINTNDFLEVLSIHLVVPFTLIQLLLPDMRKAGWGRMGEAEEIASVIAFLASDEASYITETPIPVSGGWGI
jgi:3-oxoacyl-[acyl-carrier protein] reductase